MDQPYDNSGVLFVNDKKEKENQPDYTGNITMNAHEHGPQGGDEINVIQRGRNYGWPVVSYGEEYGGGEIGLSYSPEGYTDPIWTWVPSIAPSGMSFYSGDMFPEIKGFLLVGSLKFRRIYSLGLN